jgi:glucokinase
MDGSKDLRRIALGVDIGGTNTKLGLVDEGGALLESLQVPTPPSTRDEPLDIAYLESPTGMLLRRASRERRDVAAVGVGMPMLVDEHDVITRCFNVHMDAAHATLSLKRMFGDVPCRLLNDANAAALGECWCGAAVGRQSAVMITLGTGVGGALLLGDRLVHGAHGAAGEFGHMTVNPDETVRCACGRRGCLEQYASARALVQRTHRALACSSLPSVLDPADLTVESICDAARNGDALARARLDELAQMLARGLVELAVMFDPEIFVLGGGLAHQADAFLPQTRMQYRNLVLDSCKATPIVQAQLGNAAGMIGAARVALEEEG